MLMFLWKSIMLGYIDRGVIFIQKQFTGRSISEVLVDPGLYPRI